MSTAASLLRDVQAGTKPLPITKSLANWDRKLDVAAVERVHRLKLKDMAGNRHSGEGRLRGSLLGSPCQREQIISYRGYLGAAADEVGEDLMKDGSYRHYLWQEAGLSAGFLSDIEVKAEYKPWRFGGQLDGLMAETPDWPGRGGFELKTVKWDFFKQVKNPPRNADGSPGKQVPLYKDLMQIGGYFKAMELDWFSVVYEVRGFKIEHVELMVENTPSLQIQVEATFGGLQSWIDREELPPPLPDYPNNKRCAYWCGFTRICPVASW